MKITVNHTFDRLAASLKGLESQIPFATAVALTRTAQDARANVRTEFKQIFDRPTPYTMNSVFVRGATKTRQYAELWLKGWPERSHYLEPQIKGGPRPLKRFENVLAQAGYMTRSERAVPAGGAQLDRFGNVSRGQIVKVISQLRAHNLAGSDQNATNSRRSRAKRATEQYFASKGPGTAYGKRSWKNGLKSQHLPRGIYVRRVFAWGTSVKPVFLFVDGANYRARLHLVKIVERTLQTRFPAHFDAAIRQASGTAWFKRQGSLFG